jgi:hypothetical protein
LIFINLDKCLFSVLIISLFPCHFHYILHLKLLLKLYYNFEKLYLYLYSKNETFILTIFKFLTRNLYNIRNMYDLETILYDIKNERCVLIVGPDLLNYGGNTLFELFCTELRNNENEKLRFQYIFSNEELLLLSKDTKETAFRTLMEKFYFKLDCLNNPFVKISQIPFHLIISLFPDNRLCRVFEDQKFEFQFSHFPRESSPMAIDKPSKSRPLIYNLLGNVNEGDIVITFDHLFSFLSGIMGRRELPQTLQETLKKATTFIFLGVKFERWYMQLLLKIITQGDKAYNLTFYKNMGIGESGTFIAKRLDLESFDIEPLDFLNKLYAECEEQKLLKISANSDVGVFISYSHRDKIIVQEMQKFLVGQGIEVVIDEESMQGGQKIEDFVNKIKDVRCVVAVISKNSLLSPWVVKEISITMNEKNKHLIPCYLDDSFLENNFPNKVAEKYVDDILNNISKEISQRGKLSTEDLNTERQNWVNYFNSLPYILTELKKVKCISLVQNTFSDGLKQLIDDIYKYST